MTVDRHAGLGGAAVLALLISASLTSSAFGQPARRKPPPTGDERAEMLAGIHKTYPTIPDNVANLMADARRQIDDTRGARWGSG